MTITSKDTGCLTAVPANDNVPVELRALGAAIGKSERHFYDDAEDFAYGTGRYVKASTAILPPVIALTGLAGSGKSTASKYLVEKHGYQLVKFAGPLKDMLRAIGFGEDDIEGSDKELSNSLLCDKTPRHAMQTLGTEWGRKCIGENFWTGLWVDTATGVIAKGGRVVVDDCRFPNEAAEIRKLGGVVWRMVGRGGIAGAHESEAGCGGSDIEIHNIGDIVDLRRQLDAFLHWHLADAA